MIKILKDNSVQLCCKGKKCPVVTELADGMVEILDDYGNRVVVRKEEALLISDGVKTINEQQDKKQLLLG